MDIAALILAAGAGTRFGARKPLALFSGEPLLRHVVRAMQDAGVTDIVAVIPDDPDYAAALAELPVRCVRNATPHEGMSGSLRLGLAALPRARAVLVALADQPTIGSRVVRTLMQHWRATGAHIVLPVYRGARGHPVLFDMALRAELELVRGDRGAREVVERDAARVARVAFDQPPPADIDTPAALAALERLGADPA